MTFHYLNIDSDFHHSIITKQMNKNGYAIPTSCITCNTYSYYNVPNVSFSATSLEQIAL